MSRYIVMLGPSQTRTRVLVLDGPDEILRAELPCGSQVRHSRAVCTFLEGLSLWLGSRLCVALSADALDSSFYLDLVDELGIGVQTVFYEVKVVERHRNGRRLRGVGHFADLRQLSLLLAGAQ